MTELLSILEPTCTRASVPASSRKGLLEYAADLLAERYALPARELFDELMGREKLGSTGLGEGVAIPHCRIACEGIHGACLTLEKPVDYDAMDGAPVDLVFILVVPPEETSAHLEVLAELARLYGDADNRTLLRGAGDNKELYERFLGLANSQAA